MVKFELLGLLEPIDPPGNVEPNALLLPSFDDILVVVPVAYLSEYLWSTYRCRVDVCFIGKDDILPVFFDRLVLMRSAVENAFLLVFVRYLLLYKSCLINPTALYMPSEYSSCLSSFDRYFMVF